MTEQITTEMLALAIDYRDDFREDSSLAFDALMSLYSLHDALTSGSPLPAQWPQSKELEELRAKVAKYEEALREIAGYREANSAQTELGPVFFADAYDFEKLEDMAKEALKP